MALTIIHRIGSVLAAKILGHTSDVSQSSLEQAGEAVLTAASSPRSQVAGRAQSLGGAP